jgi:hypothetical protein
MLASAMHMALKTRILVVLFIKKPPCVYRRRVGSQYSRNSTAALSQRPQV